MKRRILEFLAPVALLLREIRRRALELLTLLVVPLLSTLGAATTGTALGLVVAAVTLVIGIYIVATIQPTISGLTGTANTTVETVFERVYSSFNVLTVALIVMAAVAILALVMRLRG